MTPLRLHNDRQAQLIMLALVIALLIGMVARGDVVLGWKPVANQMAGSSTTVWQGNFAPLNYNASYLSPSPSNALVIPDAWLKEGINYFAVQQVATNVNGVAYATPLSGEVRVVKNPAVSVQLPMLTSTNLGKDWFNVSTQTVIFPTIEAQRFFMAGQIKIQRTHIISFPPTP